MGITVKVPIFNNIVLSVQMFSKQYFVVKIACNICVLSETDNHKMNFFHFEIIITLKIISQSD